MKYRHFLKRLITSALCTALLCGGMPILPAHAATLTSSYEAAKTAVSQLQARNSSGIYINHHREENDMILYNEDWDASSGDNWNSSEELRVKGRTGTNQWGYEVTVNRWGYVTAVGGNNNVIPSYGYVISGNGTSATWLRENVSVGDLIALNDAHFAVNHATADDHRAYVWDGGAKTFDFSYVTGSTTWEQNSELSSQSCVRITAGGVGVTTGSSVWQNDVLVKRTADGADPTKWGKGYVVQVGGNDIEVPSGYFAMTFAGQTLNDDATCPYNGAQLAKEYLPVGTLINCAANKVYARYDSAAMVRAAKLLAGVTDTTTDTSLSIDKAECCAVINDVTEAESSFKLVDTASMRSLYNNMVSIANGITASDTDLLQKIATVSQNADAIYRLNAEKKTVEYRATWVSSFRESQLVNMDAAAIDAAIEAEVQDIADKGFNMVLYEVFHNSCTVMPMNGAGYDGLSYEQNPYLIPTSQGGMNPHLSEPYDMLSKYVEVCHQKEIEIHIWMETFYVGYQRTNGATDALFDHSVAQKIIDDPVKYKGWLNVANNGDLYFGAAGDAAHQYFLNPGSTGARTFLMNTFRYIWNNYNIDGFHLDYIRYPKAVDYGGDVGQKCFGYDEDTLAAFKAAYPQYASYTTNNWDMLNADWVAFRSAYVTSFVGTVHDTMRQDRPDIYLTAATSAEYEEAKNYLMQDLETWFANGYIDILFPMAYGENVVKDSTQRLVSGNSGKFACSGVSGSYSAEFDFMWLNQIREAGADGIGVFDSSGSHLDSYYDYGPFSVKAITPTGNAAKAAMVYLETTMTDRVQKMFEAGAITTAKKTAILSAIDTAEQTVRCVGIADAYDAINALTTLADTLSNANAQAALRKDAAYLLKIRDNSHDAASQQRAIGAQAGFSINGTDAATGTDAFAYTMATNTLFVKQQQTTLGGALPQDLSVVLKAGVNTLTLDRLTLNTAETAIEATENVCVKLIGTSNVQCDTLCDKSVTFIGTGKLMNGSEVVMFKGDVTGNDVRDSSDIRLMMRGIVKQTTLTENQLAIGDVDGDGKVTSFDARVFLTAMLEGE